LTSLCRVIYADPIHSPLIPNFLQLLGDLIEEEIEEIKQEVRFKNEIIVSYEMTIELQLHSSSHLPYHRLQVPLQTPSFKKHWRKYEVGETWV